MNMKNRLVCFPFCFVIMLCVSGSSYAVSMARFDREFGGKGSGEGAFGKTINLAFDSEDNIYVSDKENKMIQKLGPDGNFLMQVPRVGSDVPLFNAPGDIAADNQGNIYVADWTSKHIEGTENPRLYIYGPCVHKFSMAGTLLQTYFTDEVSPKPKTVVPGTFIVDETGKYGWALRPKEYDRELLVAADSRGDVYILDVKNSVIHKYNSSGKKLLTFGRYGSGPGEMDAPSDMIADRENNILIADKGNHRVVKFDSTGTHLLSFGSKGQGAGQFIEPVSVVVARDGEILVKDSSKFERIGLEHPFRGEQERLGEEYAIQSFEDSDMRRLEERILRLEEALEEGEDREKAKEKLLAKQARYYTVIERVQKFSSAGEYIDKAIYRIDKNDRELHDLAFLALDPQGRVYLRDEDRLVIRRYTIEGFAPKLSEVEATYTARTENRDESYLEDYGDIDERADLEDRRMGLAIKQALLVNYDLTEKWNISLHDTHVLARRDSEYYTPPKPEDNYDYADRGWDNTLGFNLKFIANPDPYRYREMNLYSQLLTGFTDYHSEAIFTNVNQQYTEREGDADGIVLGADVDIHPSMNVSLEYLRLKPGAISRNFTTQLYDISGDLYQVSRSYNTSNVVVGELNIKF
jgi:DNA-binding beta-propeller fold protein YncE